MDDNYNVEEIGDAFREIHSNLRKLSRAAMDTSDLSGPRFAILMILKHHQPMKVSELQEKLHVAMSTVTQMADSLCSSEYIERVRSAEDRRVVMLNLTEKGEQLVKSLKGKHLEHLTKALSVFDRRQRDVFLENLNKLSLSLKTCASDEVEEKNG